MPRAPRPWFRFYVETFPDRKIRRLQPAERWVWAAVLGAARESPEPGRLMIADGLPMTTAELADYADVPVRLASKALAAMVGLGMVVMDGDAVTVPKFTVRQYESDDVTARTRKHRERSKDVPTEDVGTFQPSSVKRSRNGRRNTPETETEKESVLRTAEPPKSEAPAHSSNGKGNALTPAQTMAREQNLRAQSLAKIWAELVPLSNFPATLGICKRAIQAGKTDSEIEAALKRLAAEGRTLTVDTLRIELEGLAPSRYAEPTPQPRRYEW